MDLQVNLPKPIKLVEIKREKKKEERGNEQMINNFKKEKEELRPMQFFRKQESYAGS